MHSQKIFKKFTSIFFNSDIVKEGDASKMVDDNAINFILSNINSFDHIYFIIESEQI
jgi:hypothetical protein